MALLKYVFEYQPYMYTVLTKDEQGNIVETHNYTEEKDVTSVELDGNKTTVILSCGIKGTAKCSPDDELDYQKGVEIAYRRAKLKKIEKEIKKLCK